MRRSPRLLIAAALVGVLVPTVASQTAVSAVDQDLVVSATSGAPGTVIEVTSASCETSVDDNTIRYLLVRLYARSAPDQVLAGSAIGVEDEVASIIIPDWIDPSEPAVIEASCREVEVDFEDASIPPVVNLFEYDPVPFDVEAGATPPVQTRTYSRTSLQAGQAFAITASGCFLDGAEQAYVDVVGGDDLTFRDVNGIGVSSSSEIEAGSFELLTAMSDGYLDVAFSGSGDEASDVEIVEVPTDLPAGPYSSIAYCTDEAGATLMYEPELLEITGDAPFADLDLTVPAESRTATLTGGSCTAGDANAFIFAEDLDQAFDEQLSAFRSGGTGPALGPVTGLPPIGTLRSGSLLQARAGGRVLSPEPIEVDVTPADDGSWSYRDDTSFDRGFVGAFAQCGDPLEDGFIYDPAAAMVAVSDVPSSTTTTTTTAPTPAPANAVAGTPTYAG